MKVESIKINVSEMIVMGGFENKPRAVRAFSSVNGFISFINLVFVGSNMQSRPPTFFNINNFKLQEAHFC
jgi:hypothetical protein